LNLKKKFAKDEERELTKLKENAKQIVSEIEPIQKDYKDTKCALKTMRDCAK